MHDTVKIGAIGNHFELHPLLQEEILNTRHRPKFEDFEGYLFITMKKLKIKSTKFVLATSQVKIAEVRKFTPKLIVAANAVVVFPRMQVSKESDLGGLRWAQHGSTHPAGEKEVSYGRHSSSESVE